MKTENGEEISSSIAIIGASYAGLALANTLNQKSSSITFTIFDSKTLPFTYVTGGDAFNIPFYSSLAMKLALQTSQQPSNELTRQDVIESLLERVKQHLIVGTRIERIEERNHLFYLHTRRKSQSTYDGTSIATIASNSYHIYGPYQCVIGADGVRSVCRTSALYGTYLIGDARWVNDRWYDLGLRRIERGADIAIIDGLELGETFLRLETEDEDCDCSRKAFPLAIRVKFCARQIQLARMTRIISVVMVFIAMVVMKNQSMMQSFLRSALERSKIWYLEVVSASC